MERHRKWQANASSAAESAHFLSVPESVSPSRLKKRRNTQHRNANPPSSSSMPISSPDYQVTTLKPPPTHLPIFPPTPHIPLFPSIPPIGPIFLPPPHILLPHPPIPNDAHSHSRSRTEDRLEHHTQVVAPVLIDPPDFLNVPFTEVAGGFDSVNLSLP